MSHLPSTRIHRFEADPFELRITVDGLSPGQVQTATWIAGDIVKTLGDGITVDDHDGTAVLVVQVDSTDTAGLGAGTFAWQAAAGETDPPIVAVGALRLDRRLTP